MLCFKKCILATVFKNFRRLKVFRNQFHKQLMIALLLNVIMRLILYVDMAFDMEGQEQKTKKTIHATVIQ